MEFKFTANQLTIVPLSIIPTTVADPNRVVITDQNGYMTVGDVTYQDIVDAVTNTLVYTNGIRKSGQSVKLGSSLTENTLIDSPTNKSFEIISGSTLSKGAMKIDPSATYTVRLAYSDGNFANGHSYGIGLGGHGMFYSAGSSYFTIQDTSVTAGADYPAHNSLFIVKDFLHNRGVEYGGDYEANFVARSLVTKRYTDAAIATAVSGIDTGITVGVTTIASGADTRIPFNDGGVYGESSMFTWNKATNQLTVNGTTFSTNVNASAISTTTINTSGAATVNSLRITEVAVPSTVIDFDLAGQQYKDISSNTTFTFSNSAASKQVQVFLTNTSGSTITVDFTGDVQPSGGDYTIAAGKTKVFSFACSRSSIYGAIITYA